MVQKFPGIPVKAGKRKYLERYYLFSENFPPGWTVSFEFAPELLRITENSIQMVSALGYILSGLEMLTLKKKSRYYFAQFVGSKYFHPPWKFYLVQLTLLSGNVVLASWLLRSPSLTYGTRPKPNRSLSPLQRPCFPRECGWNLKLFNVFFLYIQVCSCP